MRKKPTRAEPEPFVPGATAPNLGSTASPGTRRAAKCEVCGADASGPKSEGLCWVCRRLKISAWKDTDLQANAQE